MLRPDGRHILPDRLRAALSEPWGPVVDTATLAKMVTAEDTVLAVGDVVSITLHELGIQPRLFVCDYKTQRGGVEGHLEEVLGNWGDRELRVQNPAGMVTAESWDAVTDALAQPVGVTTRIVVDGEEDLLGLPCFLEAPDGAIVLYGMPKRGVVVCFVEPGLRTKVARIVREME
jgi:uncharacterized protein (UPF0218 family)